MKIGFIGCGRMGGALLEGALKAKIVTSDNVWVSDPHPGASSAMAERFGINIAENNSAVIRNSDLVLLACKPYHVIDILEEVSGELPGNTVILSIAAGVTLGRMESNSPEGTRIIRVMPNTPSLIANGASGIAAGTHASDSDLSVAQQMLESVGIVEIVNESQLDAVTGLSGSGPAYVYTFIESLTQQAEKEGLPAETALRLAIQTVLGAARMVETTGMSPADLRNQVTSPGGTTLAGLEALTHSGFNESIAAGVHAATERSREIAEES
jgi:pyrroline-5-carboxylate reductase